MASNFRAPTSPDANNGSLSPAVLTNGARIDVRYDDMSVNDYIIVHWGAGYETDPQPGSNGPVVQILIPAAEVVKTAGQTLQVTYTVIFPGGPGLSNASTFIVPANATVVAITQVLDSNNVSIPNGGTTTSTRVTVRGLVS